MAAELEINAAILKALKFSQRGFTVTDISKKIRHNRNFTAKQLEILRAEGKVEVRKIGSARVYSLAQRVPLSAFLCFTRNIILILDRNLSIVQANDQYVGLTGLTKQELIGRNILAGTFPIVSSPEALGIIQSTGKEQVSTEIRFLKGQDEFFYKMEVIPTTFEAGETGLTVVLEDITERKRHLRNMEFLARTAMELVDLPHETDIYQYIAERLAQVVPENPRYYVFSYDEVNREFSFRAVKSEAVRQAVTELAGFDPVGRVFPIENFFFASPFFESAASFKDMREMHFRPYYETEEYSFYDACAHIFPENLCQVFLREFKIAKLYLTGLVWQDQLFGLVGIILGSDETLENRQAIESFLRQASIALARRMTEDRLLRSERRFEELINSLENPVAVIAPDDRITLLNPKFSEEFGYIPTDIPTGEAWLEKAFPDPAYRKEAIAALNPVYRETGKIPSKSFEVRCGNGERKRISFRTVLLSDGHRVVTFGGCDGWNK